MSPGEYPKQEKILKLAQLHPLRVEAYVPISMLGKVTVGMDAQIKPEDPVGGTHKAKVTVVDHVVDAGSGTLGIRMELPNPDLRIPAGLKCTVRFPQKQEKGAAATDSTTINKDR
jgi:multidrug efflux pump subunit AcrA (membrane-fusion protein)